MTDKQRQLIEALIEDLIDCAKDEQRAEHWGDGHKAQYARATVEARAYLLKAITTPPPQGVPVEELRQAAKVLDRAAEFLFGNGNSALGGECRKAVNPLFAVLAALQQPPQAGTVEVPVTFEAATIEAYEALAALRKALTGGGSDGQ